MRYINIKNWQNSNPKDFQFFKLFYEMFWGRDWDTLLVTIFDVTNPTYIAFADFTSTAVGFHFFIFVTNDESNDLP